MLFLTYSLQTYHVFIPKSTIFSWHNDEIDFHWSKSVSFHFHPQARYHLLSRPKDCRHMLNCAHCDWQTLRKAIFLSNLRPLRNVGDRLFVNHVNDVAFL